MQAVGKGYRRPENRPFAGALSSAFIAIEEKPNPGSGGPPRLPVWAAWQNPHANDACRHTNRGYRFHESAMAASRPASSARERIIAFAFQ
jgi:hypothetical protein